MDAQDTPYKSTAELLFRRRELAFNHLLRGLNENYQSGLKPQVQELELTICIKNVNWDALCCYVLCDHLVRTGEFPDWALELVDSANAVNQGEASLDETGSAPFALFYALTNRVQSNDWRTIFAKGKDLVEDIAQLLKPEDRRSTNSFLSPILDKQRYSELVVSNQEDYAHFINDSCSGEQFEMQLPCSEDGQNLESRTADVLFLEQVPQSRLFIYWGREDFDLLAYPKHVTGSEDVHWSFSINPGSGFSLKGLGYFFEKYEATIRNDRKGIPRWNDHNYSNNDDPWYDGRSHKYSLVESPRSGTKIRSYDTIKQILLSNWHSIKKESHHRPGPQFGGLQIHLTYFFFAVRKQQDLDGFSDWRNRPCFLPLDTASKVLKRTHFKIVELNRFGCIFYTTEVNENVLIEVTPDIDTQNISMDDIPTIIADTKKKARIQYESARKEFPDSYFEDIRPLTNEDEPCFEDIRPLTNEDEPCFLHLTIRRPNLVYQSEEKLNEIFNEFSSCKITPDIFQPLKQENKPADLFDLSTCISFLFDKETKEVKDPRNTKKLFILYSLFIKSSYQQFSQKLKPIPDFKEEGEALNNVLEVQKQFSRFLTNYDFVATELSFEPKIVDFAKEVFSAIHLKEQKDETNEEMRFLSDLSSSLADEKQREFTQKAQKAFILLAAFSLCDFLYAFLDGLKEAKFVPYNYIPESCSTYINYVNGILAFGIPVAFGFLGIVLFTKVTKTVKRLKDSREDS